MRPSKDAYYINIARDVAKQSTCIRRQYGAVIVKDDVIVSTGYNGSARGEENCCDNGECWREAHDIPHGQMYEKCKAVHAEMNAVINCNREDLKGATLYLAGFENNRPLKILKPCELCSRVIKNARIARVVTPIDIPPDGYRKVPTNSGRYSWDKEEISYNKDTGSVVLHAVENIEDDDGVAEPA